MKRILSILFLFLILLESSIQAIPAKHIIRIITQPDGSTLSTVLQGDENFHYIATVDGIMLQKASDGFMKYATTTSDGILSAGQYIAHDPEKREEGEKAYITEISKLQISNAILKIRAQRSTSRSQTIAKKANFPSQGTVKGLIILVQYKDVKFSAKSTTKEFQDMMTAEGYSNYGAFGSARDYFISQSSGMFTPEFDVVGPVTLPENMSYYGGNDRNGQDKKPDEMVVDACYAADNLVDFSKYDNDKDGTVDLVYIIYAGYAEAQGGPANSVWPHAWNLGSAGFSDTKMDGKRISSYACSSELRGGSGTNIDGIGTFCHEFSHCLGLPDIYDTRYSGMVGMGSWSPMDNGSYNNNSKTPAGYSAYERYSVGWLTPTVLENPQKEVKLLPMNTANQAYMLVSDKNPNEYYTIENRQQSGWDTFLPGHGMMIVHVDYVPWIWSSNIVNSSAAGHPHLQIVPADNEFKRLSGDTFPGTTKNTTFTDESTPSAFLYTGGFIGKPISNIQEKEGIITFDFMNFVGTPTATEATEIAENQFTANWSQANNATSYALTVAACMTGKESILEDFTRFTKGSLTEVNEENIADYLSEYTTIAQWNGQEIYQAGGYCRIGSRTASGSLTTPLLDLSKEKEFTLSCNIKGNKNLLNGYNFVLIDEKGQELQNQTAMMTTTAKNIYWVFSTEKTVGAVRIQTRAAAFLDYIRIYNGNVKEQLEKGETLSVPEEYVNAFRDITGNSYTVTGLENDRRYIYSVYAKQDDEISPISNKIILKTQKPSAIETVTAPQREVYTDRGMLHFFTDAEENVSIYTPSGMKVYSDKSREGKNDIPLPTGLYILTIGTDRVKIHIP